MIDGLLLVSSLYLLGWDGLHLPNRNVTPGATVPISRERICATGWGKDARHVSQSMKEQVCQRYGVREPCPGPAYEIDHLVPRELGGADDVRNLWPQAIKEARLKDTLENFLHRAVCGGSIELEAAQQGIREDWTQEYRKMKNEQE